MTSPYPSPYQGQPQQPAPAYQGQQQPYPATQGGYGAPAGYVGAPTPPGYSMNDKGGYAAPAALPPLATWGPRVGALLLDQLVSTGPMFVAGIVMMLTMTPVLDYDGNQRYDAYGAAVQEPSLVGGLLVLVAMAWALGFTIWNRWVRQGRTGQSLGKKIVGLRLVSERTLAPIGGGSAFARDLCHYLDGILYIGYLRPLWDTKRQTFADTIMHSVVQNVR